MVLHRKQFLLNIFVYLVFLLIANKCTSTEECKQTEFTCANGKCIAQNLYCNNINDCQDHSDEPRYCTRCNRTYYGEIGVIYDLELHRPKDDKIPFICYLTFTATGNHSGDIVQLTFSSFTLGRFTSSTSNGCPDGALRITESGRPQIGGEWCGTSWGRPSTYYSETNSVVVYVGLYHLSKDQSGYNFDYNMEFKFIERADAIIRYGGHQPAVNYFEPDYYLGDLISGTYCSRIFSDCDTKHCRLQSPNFPGIYPRNLTCYYAVRQHEIPDGKQSLIVIRQTRSHLISLHGKEKPGERSISTNINECVDDLNVQDHVTIYDGYTTRDPVILRFCGSGEAIPETVSSGHELLVEFSTSPYGTLVDDTKTILHGFQLDIEVRFVDTDSPTYVKSKKSCEFKIRHTGKGVLESPVHSLPGNTTCLYHLQGVDLSIPPPSSSSNSGVSLKSTLSWFKETQQPRYRIWLSIVKFHIAVDRQEIEKPQNDQQDVCRNYLNIWDGQLWSLPNCTNDLYCGNRVEKYRNGDEVSSYRGYSRKHVKLLARYCKDHVPRSCEHSLLSVNDTKFRRPCTMAESFFSTGDSMTLELKLTDSTAIRPIKFLALYEFVDLFMDGEQYGSGICSRRLSSNHSMVEEKFRSPRNIFLFGRGGRKNLGCVYRFEGLKDHKIRIVITNLVMNNEHCNTHYSNESERMNCVGDQSARVQLFDILWTDVPRVSRHCFCSTVHNKEKLLPFTFVSSTNIAELHFDVSGMNANDDFNSFAFEGTWKAIQTPICTKNMKLEGSKGLIEFTYPIKQPNEMNCQNNYRVILPSLDRFLYVKINGKTTMRQWWSLSATNSTQIRKFSVVCDTTNRIIVHTPVEHIIICPVLDASASRSTNLVEIFSEGWTTPTAKHYVAATQTKKIDQLDEEIPRTIVLEFLGREAGHYSIMWLELSRRRISHPNGFGLYLLNQDECRYRCPELNACINSSVWCDGVEHCPSGEDEAFTHCSILSRLPIPYLFVAILFILLSLVCVAIIVWRLFLRQPKSILQMRLQSMQNLDNKAAMLGEKQIIS